MFGYWSTEYRVAFRQGWRQTLPDTPQPNMFFLNPSGLRTREHTQTQVEKVWRKYAEPNATGTSVDSVREALEDPDVSANKIFTLLAPALKWSDHLPGVAPQEAGSFIFDTGEHETQYSLKLPLSGTNENSKHMVDAIEHFLSGRVDCDILQQDREEGYLDQMAIWMLTAFKYKERLDAYCSREDAVDDLRRSFPKLLRTPEERKLLFLDTTIDTGSSIQIVLDYLEDFAFPTPHVGVVSVTAGDEVEPYTYKHQEIEPFVAIPVQSKGTHGNVFKKSTLVMGASSSVISKRVDVNHYHGLGGEKLFREQRDTELARRNELHELFSS